MPQTLQTGGFRVNRFPELVGVDPKDFAADPAPVLNALMTYPAFRLALAQNADQTFELGTKKATGGDRRKLAIEQAANDVTNLPQENRLKQETTDTAIAGQQLNRTKTQREQVDLEANAETDAMIAEQKRLNDLYAAQTKRQTDAEDRAMKAKAVNDLAEYRTALGEAAKLKAENDTLAKQVAEFNAQTNRIKADKPEKRVELSRQPIDVGGVKKMLVVSRDPGTTDPVAEIVDLPEGAKFDRAPTPMELAAQMFNPPKPAVTPPAAAPSPTPAATQSAAPQIPTLAPEVALSPATPPGYFIGLDGQTYLKQPNGKIVKVQ